MTELDLGTAPVEKAPLAPKLSPQTWAVIGIACAGLAAAFWTFFRWLPTNWFGDDTYYAHGAIVPICAGLIIWDRWPKLREIPVKGANWAIVLIVGLLYVTWFAHRTDMRTVQSVLLLLVLGAGILFVGGWRWLKALAIPLGYLGFAFPFFDRIVDQYTQPLQRMSTDLSFLLLKVAGLKPYKADATTVLLNRFTLDVGVPCSGMKLLLAVGAISVFFILIAKIKWWGNLLLLASVIPLTLVVNAIRIAMIGWVGNTWGDKAGHQFHDYSGYLSLILCFVVLMKFTKVLGWK
ncbi:MAG: exosortase/archaeosortase family protein [Chlorobia bacterium]|nr:exosortase/archaeosortase family protein [Fimbriimonadaceae bacterium]